MRYSILLVLIMLVSCKEKHSESLNKLKSYRYHLEFDTDKAKNPFVFDSLVEEFRLVPLETGGNCLLGKIEERFIDNGKIFLRDKRGVYVFDINNGKFIYSITNRGKGPGEFLKIANMSIDNKILYLWDYYKAVLIAFNSETGNYLNEIEPIYGAKVHVKDENIFVNQHPVYLKKVGHKNDSMSLIVTKLHDKDEVIYSNFLGGDGNYLNIGGKSKMCFENDFLYWKEPAFNTVFKWFGDKFEPYIYCDFLDKKLTKEKFLEHKTNFPQLINEGYIFDINIVENSNIIMAHYYRNGLYYYLFDKKTKEKKAYKGFKAELDQLCPIEFCGGYKNEFWGILGSQNFSFYQARIKEKKSSITSLDPKIINLIKSIQTTDNPVLCFYKFKPLIQ